MKIAYITGMIPCARRNGTEIATDVIAQALRSAGCEVEYIGYCRPTDQIASRQDIKLVDVRPIEVADATTLNKIKWMLSALITGKPFSVAKYERGSIIKAAKKLLHEYDAIMVDKAQLADVYKAALDGLNYNIVWHAIEHQTYQHVANHASGIKKWLYGREVRLLKEVETRVADRVGAIFALTEADAQQLRDIGSPKAISIIPLVVPPDFTNEGAPEVDAALLGAWTWSANATGLAWFEKEIWPLLRGQVAVRVGGKGAEAVIPPDSGIKIITLVEDAKIFLGAARVVVIPVIGGTGVSMKVVEAISQGWATVTTSAGVRGLEDIPEYVAVADEPYEFAAAIRRFCREPACPKSDWKRLGREWHLSRQNRLSETLLRDLVRSKKADR